MVTIKSLLDYCNERVSADKITDFPGAWNGLQVSNNGAVTKIGASVDAGLVPFQLAQKAKVDFLIVHHGLLNSKTPCITGNYFNKVKLLLDHNIALYSSHIPLDCHPEIGNNALIAQILGLSIIGWIPFNGTPCIPICTGIPRLELHEKIHRFVNNRTTPILFGPEVSSRIAICSGSGASLVQELKSFGIDTLITGELRQAHFNQAQEENLNLFICGHYATEVFGVQTLAKELSQKFNIPWEFLGTDCPL